jgi:WD40-like Beta Propeller Repeat
LILVSSRYRCTRTTLAILVALLTVAGCGPGRPGSPSLAAGGAVRVLSVPLAEYVGVVWLRNDLIVALRWGTAGPDAPNRPDWVTFHADGSAYTAIAPRELQDCHRGLEINVPALLPDGRLGYLRWCNMTTTDSRSEIWALNVDTFDAERLVALGPYNPQRGQYTWNHEMTAGFFGTGSRICDGILAFDLTGISFPDTPVSDGSRTFPISTDLASETDDCASGQARAPTLSPDGKTLAFLGSTAALGQHGWGRLDAEFDLYLMDVETRIPERVPVGLVDTAEMQWSPDGRSLAVVGSLPPQDRGLYLLDPTTHALSLVATDFAGGLSWSRDGRHVIGLRDVGGGGDGSLQRQVIVVDVP